MALAPSRSRSRPGLSRWSRLSPIELGVALALGGSLLAIAVPTFSRELHASRFVEPVDGLKRIGAAAVAYGKAHPVAWSGGAAPQPGAQGFPPSAPMTPPTPPRGRCAVDPPELWDQPTWRALDFRPATPSAPHCFAFGFDSALTPARATFRAHAHGDLDGDGIPSTFEITGHCTESDPAGPVVDPGMTVESEVE
jgi:hypothetical protein